MAVEDIKINRDQIVEIFNVSLQAKEEALGFFKEISPEYNYIELLKIHGKEIGDKNFALRALFFTTTILHGDDTELSLKRITDEKLIKDYDWIFTPQKVLRKSQAEIVEACNNFFRPGGYNSNAFKQWFHNSAVLEYKFGGNLENYFNNYQNDATEIINALVVKVNAHTRDKPDFRRFGPKLSRLLIQWVNQYGLYEFKNVYKNGIPVDFQICRVLRQNNGIEFTVPVAAPTLTNRVVLPTLMEVFETENINPRYASEAVWTIGNRGCNKKRHDICPLKNMCTSLMSRVPYDKLGLFDPTDVGRFET